MATVATVPSTDGRTEQKIAEQYKVNPSTVQRAEKFAKAVDSVSENTGISPQKIVSGVSRKDLQESAERDYHGKEAPA